MIARDDHAATRPTALGRGLDTLMGDSEAREGAPESDDGRTPPPHPSEKEARPPESGIAVASGLIAGGAAGAVAIAAFALLGVRAVLSMQRRNSLF